MKTERRAELQKVLNEVIKDNHGTFVDLTRIREKLNVEGDELFAEALYRAMARVTDLDGNNIFGLLFPQELLPSMCKEVRRELIKIGIPPGAEGI